MKQYPAVLRERLLRFVDAGHSQAEAARVFGVSLSSIARWRAPQAATGELRPKRRSGRPPRISPAQTAALAAQVAAPPDATLAEPCGQWAREQGAVVSRATMARALRRLGSPLKKSPLRQ